MITQVPFSKEITSVLFSDIAPVLINEITNNSIPIVIDATTNISIPQLIEQVFVSDINPIDVGAQNNIELDISIPVLPVRTVQITAFATSWFEGNGIPIDTIGSNNDLYLDLISGDVYQKVGGTWF